MAVAVALLAGLLSGHAGSVKGISTVSVAEKVTMPKEMGYVGPTQSGAAVFGLLGAAASVGAKKVPLEKYAELSRANNIDVGQIFRTAFVERLKGSAIFDQVGATPAGGSFELQVEHYALVPPALALRFSTQKQKPILKTAASLIDAKGKKVWSGSADVLAGAKEVTGADNEEYWANPERYRSDWKIVADIAAKGLVDNLAKASPKAATTKKVGAQPTKRTGR